MAKRKTASTRPRGRARATTTTTTTTAAVLDRVRQHAFSTLSLRQRTGTNLFVDTRVYKTGEMFYEQPGATHEVSKNASQTVPAKLLAMIFAKKGSTLTTPGRGGA